MKIKNRKMTAFFTTWITLVAIAVLTIILSPGSWTAIGSYWLFILLCNAIGFISFTVLKDWIRSKHFRPELLEPIFNKENEEDEGK